MKQLQKVLIQHPIKREQDPESEDDKTEDEMDEIEKKVVNDEDKDL